MKNDDKPEPSAYALCRKLKATGYVPSANLDGKIMVSASEEVPDAPLSDSMAPEASKYFVDNVVLESDWVDLAS